VHIQAFSALALVIVLFFLDAQAYDENDSNNVPVNIVAESSYLDSDGRLSVVGTVRNTGTVPVQVIVGLEVHDEFGKRTEQEPTYGRIIWPLNDSPFKFTINSGTAGDPFVLDVIEVEAARYDNLILNYTSMATGEERAFIGTVKNIAPYDLYNVSVFASVRSENATQLDSVRTNLIPVLKPNEEQSFIAVPDAAVKSNVYYYSCAGLDFDKPITTIDAGDGEFIAYDLRAAAQISLMRYENEIDSIVFGVRPYSPIGGEVSLMIPQLYQHQAITVLLDGDLHESLVTTDGKTIFIDFFVPQGEHQVRIQGARTNL
jgi:hypothetical protein